MASYAVIPNIATLYPQYDLLSTVNVPLTGSTPLVIDGVTATNGMYVVLSNQTTASQNGLYSVGISGGTYTLTLVTALNTTTANNVPFFFEISQGSANIGTWKFVIINSVTSFTHFTIYGQHETLTISGTSINSGQSFSQAITYSNTYARIDSISVYTVSTTSGQSVLINCDNVVGATDLLTGQTRILVNMGNTVASGYNLIVKVIGA